MLAPLWKPPTDSPEMWETIRSALSSNARARRLALILTALSLAPAALAVCAVVLYLSIRH